MRSFSMQPRPSDFATTAWLPSQKPSKSRIRMSSRLSTCWLILQPLWEPTRPALPSSLSPMTTECHPSQIQSYRCAQRWRYTIVRLVCMQSQAQRLATALTWLRTLKFSHSLAWHESYLGKHLSDRSLEYKHCFLVPHLFLDVWEEWPFSWAPIKASQ